MSAGTPNKPTTASPLTRTPLPAAVCPTTRAARPRGATSPPGTTRDAINMVPGPLPPPPAAPSTTSPTPHHHPVSPGARGMPATRHSRPQRRPCAPSRRRRGATSSPGTAPTSQMPPLHVPQPP
ncbi:hypothetical protein HYPSUDRAFT_210118 [Hypholoma sublateritium FD-334 SS-4]|uniref:Uncharacterized protein n=1 Tax=Hypholoma sublateritium (strain FD-334 SS-4) TaxID=945553 RepID=A0A0D2NW58_HYPSF|nr:hypothetical protein HYPSUDRAFT_210118 [Hypholoma sublateritium FD-334 SS-4]